MGAPVSQTQDDVRVFIGVIGDEDTTLGFLLAGIGETKILPTKNYMMVTNDNSVTDVEKFFVTLYQNSNIGIILVASDIWHYLLPAYNGMIKRKLPIILEVPMKCTMTTPLKLKEREVVKRKTEIEAKP
ncbi:V-type proton ATPase subunit F-like [Glossina fuscipes]|uniref:V-type proton ATPase subunit F-like n=2 Tax=Nemorhina TaxID=44051 RepID=A0A8U0WGC6_9MUSC|nr:V-type proton ATPase subunit F-like [Glossina fuscipes]